MSAQAPSARTGDGLRALVGHRLVVWGLGIAIGYGAFEQGAFYGSQLRTVAVAVAAALAGWGVLGRRNRPPLESAHRLVAACLVALAGWAMVCGAAAGDPAAGLPTATVSLLVAAALVAAAGLASAQRATLTHVVVLVGVVVSLSAWTGVALHREPWALRDPSLWRGASTLTYANAAAAFLAVPLLVVGRRVVAGSSRWAPPIATVLVVGWASTLSRGGTLSLAAGLALSTAVVRLVVDRPLPWRRAARRLWPVVAGGALGFAALVPSLPERGDAYPWLAASGLLTGAALSGAAAPAGRRVRRHRLRFGQPPSRVTALVAVALVVGVAAGLAALPGSAARRAGAAMGDAAAGILETRIDARSTDRADLQRVTWRQFADHPVIGVGPGQLNLRYVSSAGERVQAKFTHNEYLQLGAEVGVPGVLLAVVAIVALAWSCVSKTSGERGTRVGSGVAGVAMVATFAVHSSLDFLWHIPALPLLVVVTAGTVSAGDSERKQAVPRSDQ